MAAPDPTHWGGDEGDARQLDVLNNKGAKGDVLDAATAYNEGAEYYDDWKWQKVWQAAEWPCVARILEEYGLQLNTKVLDIGSGTGSYLTNINNNFPVYRSYGIDISRHMVALAKRKLPGNSKAEIKCADVREGLCFEDGYFDIVLLCRVGSHIDDITALSREMARVLRSGGLTIICDIDPSHTYEVTRIPCRNRKLAVETHKHSVAAWNTALADLKFTVTEPVMQIWTAQVRKRVHQDDLPRSLAGGDNRVLSFVLSARKR